MDFSQQNNAEITVSYLHNMPNVQPNNPDAIFTAKYWVIDRSENSPFETDLTFTVTSGLPDGLNSNPEMVKLYTRPTYSDGDWIIISEASIVDAAQNKATFNNITDLGQFYIGIESPKVTLVKTPDEFIFVDDGINYNNFGSSSQYVFEDLNNNGLLDLLVGTNNGKIKHFEQDDIYPSNFNIMTNDFNSINAFENADPTLTDIDNDGLFDLVIGNSLGALSHYEQVAQNSFIFTQVFGAINTISAGSLASPDFTDLDNDGLLDLLIGNGAGNIIWYEQLTINSSSFVLQSNNFNSISTGTNAKPEITDFENNGLLDLIMGNPDGTLSYFKQNLFNSPTFTLVSESFSQFSGIMGVSPSFCDLDGDLLQDMIVTQTNGVNFHYEQEEISEIEFGKIFVGDSAIDDYLIKAENLMSNLQVTVSEDFCISLSEESGFTSDILITPISGFVNERIYVKFIPGEYDESYGEVNHSSDLNYYSDIYLYGIKKQTEPYSSFSMDLSDNDDYINFGNDVSLDIARNITLEVWVKVDSSGSNMTLLKKGDIRLLHWDAVYENSTGHGFQLNLPGVATGWWEFGDDLNYDDWNHIAWSYSISGELKAYVNGFNVRTSIFTESITFNTDDLIISSEIGNESFLGEIDELRIWNTVRSEEEIRENMYHPLYGF